MSELCSCWVVPWICYLAQFSATSGKELTDEKACILECKQENIPKTETASHWSRAPQQPLTYWYAKPPPQCCGTFKHLTLGGHGRYTRLSQSSYVVRQGNTVTFYRHHSSGREAVCQGADGSCGVMSTTNYWFCWYIFLVPCKNAGLCLIRKLLSIYEHNFWHKIVLNWVSLGRWWQWFSMMGWRGLSASAHGFESPPGH